MNTPLLLASVALLTGVAARPIVPERRGDDFHELARSPDKDDRQAFLSGFGSLNPLLPHNVHDDTHASNSDAVHDSNTSPKLTGVDGLSVPDPGLASPYMGAQRHLSRVEQELGLSPLTLSTPDLPVSPSASSRRQPAQTPAPPDHSPKVVLLVIASAAALVLLGLTIILVHAAHLLRDILLKENVWKHITGRAGLGSLRDRGEKAVDNGWSEKGNLMQHGELSNVEHHEVCQQGITGEPSATTPVTPPHLAAPTASQPSEGSSEEDPDIFPLPEKPTASALLLPGTLRQNDRNREMGLAVVGWTYDNWLMHFMMALFGWLGVFFGNAHD